MGIKARHGDAVVRDSQAKTCIVAQLNDFEHAILLDAVACLAQGTMGRNVNDSQVVVGEHHRVRRGARIRGVNLRMPVKVTPLGLEREVHRLLIERVGAGSVDLASHRKLDGLDNALESRHTTHGRDLAEFELIRVDQIHVVHIDSAGLELCLANSLDAVNGRIGMARNTQDLLDHRGIAHH